MGWCGWVGGWDVLVDDGFNVLHGASFSSSSSSSSFSKEGQGHEVRAPIAVRHGVL